MLAVHINVACILALVVQLVHVTSSAQPASV